VGKLFLEISATHPWEANRVIVLLATIYSFAEREKTCLPPGFKNPAKRTRKERNSEPPRARVLKTDERPRLLEAIEAEPNVYHRALFKLLLLTGLRKSELLNARYSELDLREKTLHLSQTKSGNERLVPLSDTAIEIIRSLPRRVDNEFVFPSPKSQGPMSDPKVQWQRVRRAAGCPDLRVHDLRRTASHAIMKKVKNLKSAQMALGHADIQTTLRHYALAEEAEAREGVEALAETFLTGA
jgi:integrase